MVVQGSRDKHIKRLKNGTKTTKNHRWEPFSQRIAKLKIDPVHRVRRASFGEDEDETTSYFRSALDHWVDMNLSDTFSQFTRRINPLSESLAQILYHEEKIMGLLVEFIEKRDEHSMEPLLSLLAQFARDLGVRFEKHFATSVTLVASVAATHQDVEVVEWSFTCLAWIFKFLSRLLVPDMRQLLGIMTPYLGKERQKPFVARFAAESISFLIRKAGLVYYKNKVPLENAVSFLYKDISETAEEGKDVTMYKEGLMVMFSDAMKGINNGLHSNGTDILRCVFDLIPPTSENRSVPREVAYGVLTNLIHHTLPETFGPVLDTVREFIESRSQGLENENFSECCHLMLICVATRKGHRVTEWKPVHQVLVSLLQPASASPEKHSDAIPQLLTAVAYALQRSPMDEMLQFVRPLMELVSTGSLSQYFLFFCTTFSEWGSERFQSLLLPHFQKFISSSWQDRELETCLALLRLNKSGCISSEPSKPGYVSCPDSMKSCVLESLKYPTNDDFRLNVFMKLSQSISLFGDSALLSKFAKKLHQNVSTALKDAASETETEKIGQQLYLGQGFKTYVQLASQAGELDMTLWSAILSASQKFSTLPLFLEAVLAFIMSSPESSDLQSSAIDGLAQRLILNLAGPSHRLRLVSLQILRELVTRINKGDASPISLAIEIEETELTLQSARVLAMHVRKLAILYPQVASQKWMATLIPYYCFGLFSKKMTPLWEDSAAALKTMSEHPEGEKIVSDLSFQWLQERDSSATIDEPQDERKDEYHAAGDFICFNVGKVESALSFNLETMQDPTSTLLKQFQQDHAIAKLIPDTPRSHALMVLNATPSVAEKRARQIVPMFLSWASRDDQDDLPNKDDSELPNDQIRWGFRDRLSMLALFGQFVNPKVLFRANEVHEAVLGLLCHGNSETQKSALKALFTWKNPHVLPYKENLLNVLDEVRFKDELAVFVHVGSEDSMIEQEHRPVLIPVLLRLLYGRMISKAGANSSQAGQSGRRKAILRTLSHLSENEFATFMHLSFGPLADVQVVKDNKPDPTAFSDELTHPRRQLGLLKMVETVFDTLQNHMDPFTEQTMNVLLYSLVRACRALYVESSPLYVDRKDERILAVYQNIRQTCIRCLSLVFSVSKERDWTPYVQIIYSEMINSRLEQFPTETAQGVSGLLRLFHTWASSPRSTFYLVQHNKDVLTKIVDCLSVESARDEVKIFVLDEVLVPLVGLASGKKLEDDEEMSDFSADQIRSEVLSPYLEHALFHLGRLLKRGPSKPVLFSGVTALSLIAPCVESSTETSSLISIATYLLRQPADRVNPKTKSGLLKILQHFLPLYKPEENAELFEQVFDAVSSMFDYFKDDVNRETLAKVFVALASHDPQLEEVAGLCTDLNSRSMRRLEPDYERRLQAFRRINDELSQTLTAKQWRPLLYNMMFHVKDEEELAVRTSASHGLKRFVDKAAAETDVPEFEALVNDVFMPSLQYGLRQKSEMIRSEVVSVLGYYVKLNPSRPSVQDMHGLLVGDDEEASFFTNILHIQQHRRLRALRRLAAEAGKGNITHDNLGKIFLPLIEHFAFEEASDESGHNLIAEAVATIGSVGEWLDWNQFRANFRRYRGYMQSKPDMEKNILRLLGRMSDALSTAVSQKKGVTVAEDGDEDQMEISDAPKCQLAKSAPSLAQISKELTTNFIPFLTEFVHHKQESEMSLRLPAAVTTIKLLKIIPEQEMAIRLPPVLLDVCGILKSKVQESRDTARKTLNDISLLLGPSYFNYILKELRNTLLRGYQLHVLSFTVHSMLVYTTDHFPQGALDYCLADLVAVVMDDIFGTVGQEKDAEGYVSKMKEVKSSKSYDSMELLAKNATISQLSNLIRPVQALLREKLNSNIVKKIDELMRRIGIGLLRNPGAESRELLIFCYEVIKESYQDNSPSDEKAAPKFKYEERFLVKLQGPSRGEKRGTTASHVYKLTRFSLDILRAILNKFGSLLTPANLSGFLPIIGDALVQAHEEVKIAAMRLLSTIIKLPMPELDDNSAVYLTEAVKLVKESPTTNSEAAQASLKMISALIRERKGSNVRDGHLSYLLHRLKADIEEPDRQGITFNFIRAVMSRKFVVPEIYELMDQIAAMMVTNQTRSARDLARGTYIHFLIEYPQAKNRWTKQLGFLAKNLDYKHQEGRQSVLEAIHMLLSKTGTELAQDIVSTFFLPVVLAMANDESPECREMAGTLLAQFYGRADQEVMKTILRPLHTWLEQTDNMALGSIGLQAMRIFFEAEDIEKEKEARFVVEILPSLMQPILQDQQDEGWETLYFALQLFTKLCKTVPSLALSPKCASIWAAIQESLFFPHAWVKTCAANLVGMWLADLAKTHASTGYSAVPLAGSSGLALDKDAMLQLLRASCRSLRTPGVTEELAMQSVRNLMFLGRCCAQNGIEFQKFGDEDVESEDEEDDDAEGGSDNGEEQKTIGTAKNKSALSYLFKQVSNLLRREVISSRPEALVPKTSSIALLAALIRHLEAEQIHPSISVILLPLQHLTDSSIPAPRSSDPVFQDTYKSFVSNCHEVLDLIQKKLGTSEYIAQMSKVQESIKERREGRRAKRRIEAVADPERFEKDKRRRNDRKKDKRREKALEHRGKRRGW